MPTALRFILAGLLLALQPALALAQTLAVAADSSLADAVAEVARLFEAAHTGVTVKLDVAAAGVLLEKIAAGTRFDLLVSADTDTIARGVDRRLLAGGPPRLFAGNAVVLVVPAARGAPLRNLAELAAPEVQRIAIGRIAGVPAGRHAREAIDAERLWPALQRKMVYADSVGQVLAMVARGEVDAGFVYRTDAAAEAGVRVALTPASPTPVRHAAALVAGSAHEALAREFVAALTGPAARAILERRGFTLP